MHVATEAAPGAGQTQIASWGIVQQAYELLQECESEVRNWQYWLGGKTTVGANDEVGIWFGYVGGYREVESSRL